MRRAFGFAKHKKVVSNETLFGADGIDVIRGGRGADNIDGMSGNDALFGGRGSDVLAGGYGANFLTGGRGHDVFFFALFDDITTISDFTSGKDRVRTAFINNPEAGNIVFGAEALDGDDYLIYDSVTGRLLYDHDGVGGDEAVQFAVVNPGTSITASDFF